MWEIFFLKMPVTNTTFSAIFLISLPQQFTNTLLTFRFNSK